MTLNKQQLAALGERKYSLAQASFASRCSQAMIQNRISRGQLSMPMGGTGSMRLFSVLDMAKLALMEKLNTLGIAALQSSMLANQTFNSFDGLPRYEVITSTSKQHVATSAEIAPAAALARALKSTRGIVFFIHANEIIEEVLERVRDLPPTRGRGRPRKSTEGEG